MLWGRNSLLIQNPSRKLARHGHEAWRAWERQRRTERRTVETGAKWNGLGASVQQKAQRAVNKQAGCCWRINPWSFASLLIAMWTNKEHILFSFFFFFYFHPHQLFCNANNVPVCRHCFISVGITNKSVRFDWIRAVSFSLCVFSTWCFTWCHNIGCSVR